MDGIHLFPCHHESILAILWNNLPDMKPTNANIHQFHIYGLFCPTNVVTWLLEIRSCMQFANCLAIILPICNVSLGFQWWVCNASVIRIWSWLYHVNLYGHSSCDATRHMSVKGSIWIVTWWQHAMGILSALQTLRFGNPLVEGGFPTKRASNVELWLFLSCWIRFWRSSLFGH